MKSIKVTNLRSIKDSGLIKLNSLNFFLGKNSSGKSSIIRLFPMIKESVGHELRGPLMWYGDTYDFGDFKTTINNHANPSEDTISISFSWNAVEKKMSSRCEDCRLYDRSQQGFLKSNDYELQIYIGSVSNKTVCKKLILKTGNHLLEIETSKKASNLIFKLDDKELPLVNATWDYITKGLVPNICWKKGKRPSSVIQRIIEDYIPDDIDDVLTSEDYRKLFCTDSINYDDIFTHITNIDNPFGRILKKSLLKESEKARKLCENIVWQNIISTLSFADSYVTMTFKRSHYIMPIRYSFGRYIRNKDLAVEDIDASGKNVMEFILSLSKKKLEHFNDFLFTTIGIKTKISSDDSNNKSIIILENNGNEVNIVDVGYGITQLLPIATMLWNCAHQKNECEFADIIVIEQPEVHLHPHLQGALALLFVKAIELSKKNKGYLKLIIETHSSILINRVGRYVRNYFAKKENVMISNEDISIYLFDKEEDFTQITSTSYDEQGRIIKWPIGFLD